MLIVRILLAFLFIIVMMPAPATAEAATVRVLLREAEIHPLFITSSGGLVVRDDDRSVIAQGSDVVVEVNQWYVERRAPVDAAGTTQVPDGAQRRYPAGYVRYWYGGFSTGEEARAEAHAIGGWPVRAAVAVRRGGEIVAVHYRVPVTIEPSQGFLRLDGAAFRGSFVVSPAGNGIRVVNQVDREEYLYSVVGAEMSPSWHLEALKAQAIAARTYLRTTLRSRGDYDICATEFCQVYAGMRTEGPAAIRAVRETEGMLVTYAGQPITALYSANAGGYTESSENIFPNAAPYLRAVSSEHDVQAARSGAPGSWEWRVTIPEDRLIGLLSRKMGGLRTVTRVVETERTAGGRVIGLRFDGAGGSVQLVKDEVRWVLALRSNLIAITFEPARYELVPFGDPAARRQLLVDGGYWIADVADGPMDATGERRGRAGWQVFRVPGRLHVSGRGYGHGVGLSQWGAQGMALAGRSFQDILAHYYLGTAVERPE